MNPQVAQSFLWDHIIALVNSVGILLSIVISAHNANKIQDVHLSLNSRLTELVQASVNSGRQQERDAQKS